VRRNTPALETLQADFQNYILGDDGAMAGKVRATAKADAATLLAVYRDGYALRLLEALETNFSTLKQVLGDDDFDAMGRGYIAAHPSKHFSIRWFGDRLADYLASTVPWSGTPALAELATLEWTLAGAFDSADATPVAIEEVAAIAPEDWPNLRLGFHPSLQVIDFAWTVPELWNAMNAGEEADAPERRGTAVPFAIWRHDQGEDRQNFFRSLDPAEAWMLAEARGGAAFGALCEGLCRFVDADQAGAQAAAHLRGWIEQGLVVGVEA
jgi:hypothetical protein